MATGCSLGSHSVRVTEIGGEAQVRKNVVAPRLCVELFSLANISIYSNTITDIYFLYGQRRLNKAAKPKSQLIVGLSRYMATATGWKAEIDNLLDGLDRYQLRWLPRQRSSRTSRYRARPCARDHAGPLGRLEADDALKRT